MRGFGLPLAWCIPGSYRLSLQMICLPSSPTLVSPCGVPIQYRDTVRARAGDWEITTWDWDSEHPDHSHLGYIFGLLLARLYGDGQQGRILQKTTLVLKEDEVPRLMHQIVHGMRNKTKMESVQANLEQTAQTLWPSGSLEHVSMRFLMVPLI